MMKVKSVCRLMLLGTFLVGCGQDVEKTSAEPLATLPASEIPDDPTGLYIRAACDQASVSPETTQGRTFEYRFTSGGDDPPSGRRETIRAITGDLAAYLSASTYQGMAMPAEDRQRRLGFLPTSVPGATIRYENAEAVVAGLEPGQSAVLPMAESVQDREPVSGQARVTFVSCGVTDPAVTGAPNEPVRIYRLMLPHSTPDTPGVLSSHADLEFAVSPRLGWPIVERSPSGQFVLTSVSG